MKIIRLPGKYADIVGGLEQLLEMARQGEIESFVFAAQMATGEVATSWYDGEHELGGRQNLIAHLQLDVMMAVVQANLE